MVLGTSALITASSAAAASPGPDVSVGLAGNYPTGPSSSGNFSVSWTSVGSADYTGVTHLTVDLPPGLTTSGALMYSTPYDYTFTEAVSPDGRHLDATFIGTRVPGRGDFMKVQVASGAATPSGTIVATVANRDDVNPANNVASYTVNGAQQPPVIPAAPVVSGIDTTTGPGAGGTVVTVTGSNLDTGFVLFGNDNSTSASCTSTSCTATSPGGSGTVPVTVVTPGGSANAPTGFTYTGAPPPPPAAPVVSSVNVHNGPAAGGTSVAVIGSNLSGGSILFGGTPATHVSCGPSFCTSTSPAGTGTVDVTVTTAGGTSATSSADQFAYDAAPPPPPANLVPNAGFESSALPSDFWGGRLSRSTSVVHSGSAALAQTTTATSGGWDLDADSSWYAPIVVGKSYTASVWVRATASTRAVLNVDLLNTGGSVVDVKGGSAATLTANTWTKLTLTFTADTSGEANAAFEPNFSRTTKGAVLYWDDLSLTAN